MWPRRGPTLPLGGYRSAILMLRAACSMPDLKNDNELLASIDAVVDVVRILASTDFAYIGCLLLATAVGKGSGKLDRTLDCGAHPACCAGIALMDVVTDLLDVGTCAERVPHPHFPNR